MTRHLVTGAAAAVALLALGALAPAQAATVNYKADLEASSEVPPNTGNGKGSLTATYDTTSRKLTYQGSYSGLSGPAIAAHFHGPAGPGKNAGVLVPVKAANGSFEGSATLTEAQAKDLADGEMYFNIHTAAHKGGEIRGQVMKAE
ncbi:MAG TPA: CHRD domain-containing protein [Hyphomicrobiales bacterium]|nr:CHRD domain-containing protein [Hyphomicrobiales bacterium]